MNAVSIRESLEKLAEAEVPENPFPGLRPFELHESFLFFGREGQSERLISLLAVARFVAVVGCSGSGKSSLVRAGLLPALLGGMMASAGSQWRIALLRPGNDPIGSLALALNECGIPAGAHGNRGDACLAMTEAMLRRGNRGLIEAGQQGGLGEAENLLVLVDQFEELFRFADERKRSGAVTDEAAAFVKLLLEARQQSTPKIYVVLTMRSDFLGDCARFWDLPEAINQGQYLIPRLGRDQLRAAITGPVAVGGGEISPLLVNRLLNDIGDDQDQLPILQHALMRTWDVWRADHRPGEPLDLRHYEATGGMAKALSIHADEACGELSDERSRAIAEVLFRCLTEKGEDGREIRRPCALGDIAAAASATEAEVAEVIEIFRAPGRSFLMPPAGTPLSAATMIDISHESLIRVWQKLRDWVQREAECARLYRRLAETAVLHEKGEAEPIRGAELQKALAWREQNRPTPAWAERYAPRFDLAMAFLESSRAQEETEALEKERQRQRQLQLARLLSLSLAGLLAVAVWAAVQIHRSAERAKAQERVMHRHGYADNVNLAQGALASNDLEQAQKLLKAARPSDSDRDQGYTEDFAWRYLWGLAHPQSFKRLEGHEDSVNIVAFAPDGRTLATASDDGTVRVWEGKTGLPSATLGEKGGPVVGSVAFAPDGRLLASGSGKDVKLWDASSHSELTALKQHTDTIQSVAFSVPDGRWLVSGSDDDAIGVWDVASRKKSTFLRGHQGSVYSLAFSPDGKILASGSTDKTIRFWDFIQRREPPFASLKGFSDAVTSVAFSRDGWLAATGLDGSLKIWADATHEEEPMELVNSGGRREKRGWAVAFSPDGSILASGGDDHRIRLWNVRVGREIADLRGHEGAVRGLAFSPDGRWLASASADKTGGLWELAARRELAVLADGDQAVRTFAFSPDGTVLVSGGENGTLKLWNPLNRQDPPKVLGRHEPSVERMVFDREGKRLATLSTGWGKRTVKLWDMEKRQEIPAPDAAREDEIQEMAFDSKGALTIVRTDASTSRWDGTDWMPLAAPVGEAKERMVLAVAPDGRRSVNQSQDAGFGHRFELWDLGDGKTIAPLEGLSGNIRVAAFSPRGTILASGNDDGALQVWDVDKREPVSVSPPMTHGKSIQCLAFSPDGQTLASGDNDGKVKLWDTVTWTELATLDTGDTSHCAQAFSPDSRMLATKFPDGKIRLWIGASDAEIDAVSQKEAKSAAGDNP